MTTADPATPGGLLDSDGLLAELGLPPVWTSRGLLPGFPKAQVLHGDRGWAPQQVLAWLAAQRLDLSLAPVTTSDVRLVARRLRGESITHISRSSGRSTNLIATRSRRAATALVLAVEPDVVRVIVRQHLAGVAVADLARKVRVGRGVLRLIVDGWTVPPGDVSGLVQGMWAEGATWQQIGQAAGKSASATQRLIAELELPSRLSMADIARLLGVSRATVTSFGVSKVLPPADGHLTSGRPWWWATTIEQWSLRVLRQCPDCRARVVGLAQHRRRSHRA